MGGIDAEGVEVMNPNRYTLHFMAEKKPTDVAITPSLKVGDVIEFDDQWWIVQTICAKFQSNATAEKVFSQLSHTVSMHVYLALVDEEDAYV